MIGAVSVVSMPRNATSGACSLRYAAFMSGVSARHGGHHVAQKLSTVILPAVAEAFNGVPASVVAWNGGAAEPIGALAKFGAAPSAAKTASNGKARPYRPCAMISEAGKTALSVPYFAAAFTSG